MHGENMKLRISTLELLATICSSFNVNKFQIMPTNCISVCLAQFEKKKTEITFLRSFNWSFF